MTTDDRGDELTALLDAAMPRTDEESDAIRGLRRVTPHSQVSVMFKIFKALDRGDESRARTLIGALRRIADGWPYPHEDPDAMTMEEFDQRYGTR